MTDNERTYLGVKKLHEILYLTLKHYIPLGKAIPQSYRDVFYPIYKLVDSGVLDNVKHEKIAVEETTKQPNLFDKLTDCPPKGKGMNFDNSKSDNNKTIKK